MDALLPLGEAQRRALSLAQHRQQVRQSRTYAGAGAPRLTAEMFNLSGCAVGLIAVYQLPEASAPLSQVPVVSSPLA